MIEPSNTSITPGRFGPCPECQGPDLRPITDGEETNFLCSSCGLCWHWELGWIRRVDPFTCPGCPHRSRCLAVPRPYGRTPAGPRPLVS